MSSPMCVAAAVEGPTDAIALEAILSAIFPDVELEFQHCSRRDRSPSARNCLRTRDTVGGSVSLDYPSGRRRRRSISRCSVLEYHDLLVVQVDADVAHSTYQSANIDDAARDDLPCDRACPPANATTDALQAVILGWLGEDECPGEVVLCTPSKSIDTWVLAAVCPENPEVRKDEWECNLNPTGQLGTLPKPARFGKNVGDYRDRQDVVERELACGCCSTNRSSKVSS